MKIRSFIVIAAAICFAIVAFGCGGTATNTTTNTTVNRTGNTTSTTTTTTTSTSSNTTAPTNTEVAKSDEPDTGVAECDEYIKKYEACLTTIAEKAPQAAPGIRASYNTARSTIRSAASTPAGKSTLPSICKQMTDTAKSATSQWCTW
jgi:hypothetical protein